MRLPSGTRMCLLLVFGFMLITTEFPEFSRFKASSRAPKSPLLSSEGEQMEGDEDGESVDLAEANAELDQRSSILVEAIFIIRRGWGRGWGGGWGYRRSHWGGGWGYRRRHWGGWGYRRRCCWGK